MKYYKLINYTVSQKNPIYLSYDQKSNILVLLTHSVENLSIIESLQHQQHGCHCTPKLADNNVIR